MVVHIRFGHGAAVRRGRGKNRRLAWAAGALLTPAAVMAFAMGAWRLSADLGWAGRFAFSQGLLSHWQVWFAVAAAIEFCAWSLSRYGQESAQGSQNAPKSFSGGKRTESHTAG